MLQRVYKPGPVIDSGVPAGGFYGRGPGAPRKALRKHAQPTLRLCIDKLLTVLITFARGHRALGVSDRSGCL